MLCRIVSWVETKPFYSVQKDLKFIFSSMSVCTGFKNTKVYQLKKHKYIHNSSEITFRECVNDNNKMSRNNLKNISPHIHNFCHHLKSVESSFVKTSDQINILLNCLRVFKIILFTTVKPVLKPIYDYFYKEIMLNCTVHACVIVTFFMDKLYNIVLAQGTILQRINYRNRKL